MSSEKRYDYDPETGTIMTPLGNIWYDLEPAADRLNAQAERIAGLEAENERLRRIITQAPAEPSEDQDDGR